MDVFPRNEFVRIENSLEAVEGFVQHFLVAKDETARKYDSGLKLFSTADYQAKPVQHHLNVSPTILICGHNSRDTRCGTLGPILRSEIQTWLRRELRQHFGKLEPEKAMDRGLRSDHPLRNTNVALISHIGGHAFAGNLVIYLPPAFEVRDTTMVSPLAGKGIWYGRVEPRHIDGIMEETVKGGRIIQELARGIHCPIQDR